MRTDRPVSRVSVFHALLFSAVSLGVTGFQFGVSNNVFHIPYVLNLASLPEFSNDAFYQTLGNYISIVWVLIRIVSTEENIEGVFLIAHVVSRAATFLVLVLVFQKNDLKSPAGIAVCLAVVALTPWLIGFSVVGGHGMFIGYFTHTETTWPFVLLSLVLLQIRKLKTSAAMVGLVFSINAFVGVWLVFIVAFAALFDRQSYKTRKVVDAVGVMIVVALPVALWIVNAVSGPDQGIAFSYIEYIRSYFPAHFLIEAATWKKMIEYALLAICGLLATLFLPNTRFWVGVQLACVAIFLIGIPLPYMIDNNFAFNLHLLRSDGLEQEIAIVLSALAGSRLLFYVEVPRQQFLGGLVLASLAASTRSASDLAVVAFAFVAASPYFNDGEGRQTFSGLRSVSGLASKLCASAYGLFILASAYQVHQGHVEVVRFVVVLCFLAVALLNIPTSRVRRLIMSSGIALVCASVIISTVNGRSQDQRIVSNDEDSWNSLVAWIRGGNIPGPFLIPISAPFHSGAQNWFQFNARNSFQLNARRRVWVDWKQGAAVMWAPKFYPQWALRFAQVKALKSPESFIAYARENRIRSVVINSNLGECPSPAKLLKRSGSYALCGMDETDFR